MTTNEVVLRNGSEDDAVVCQRLTRQHPHTFGFLPLPSLRECARRGTLALACIADEVVGFVSYRACRDGWQTVYELCVATRWHGHGVGQALLASVPRPVRLKCPTDLERSNRFYRQVGMTLTTTETHRHGRALSRPLNVYHLEEPHAKDD
jgi:GNAT superfamily N-acetyltransferase